MDTKSKNINDNIILRVTLFLICTGLFVATLYSLFMAKSTMDEHFRHVNSKMNNMSVEDFLFAKGYMDSEGYGSSFFTHAMDIMYILNSNSESFEDDNENGNIQNDIEKRLSSIQGLYYYAFDGKGTITNLGVNINAANGKNGDDLMGFFTEMPAYMVFKDGEVTLAPPLPERFENRYFNEHGIAEMIKSEIAEIPKSEDYDAIVYMAYDRDYLEGHSKTFAAVSSKLKRWGIVSLGLGIICLIIFIYLTITTGRKDAVGIRKRYKLDSIPTEIQLALLLLAAGIGIASCLTAVESAYYYGLIGIAGLTIVCIFAANMGLWFLLSIIRSLKSRSFIKNSISYKIIAFIGRHITDIYHGGSITRKVVLVALSVCLLSATIVLAPIVLIAILVIAPKWVKSFQEIQKGVDEVKDGNLNYKINLKGKGELVKLAEGIDMISEATNIAVQNEIRNQKMKAELITNVSHDLKTPLTSIITYVDLLKTEGFDSKEAHKYLEVLDQKSRRLQKLTENLFEAAKASSGDMPVNLEKVDLVHLINQAMGEMSGEIDDSKLEFRINTSQDKQYVLSDGKLTWRIIENLIGNVLKYALPGSRVYIDINDLHSGNGKSGSIIMEIKNVSKYELNISADELMERFTRGDESRTTEGSGLGLAITRDLILLQKGWFEIQIDGDLFKARVILNAYE